MRLLKQDGLLRLFGGSWKKKSGTYEAAYVKFTKRFYSLGADIEFPTEWHDNKRAWLRIGLGFISIGISVPWYKMYPDYTQCSGPTYGIMLGDNYLIIHYGQCKGKNNDPIKFIDMPWNWGSAVERKILGPQEGPYSYTYFLKSGEIQYRKAMITPVYMRWERFWIPRKLHKYYIDIDFDNEVGERSGSWKGGCISCSYNMNPNETPEQTLKRMEIERKF